MAKEVVFKIKLEGGEQTIKTLNGIEQEIAQIQAELKDTDIGSAKFQQLATSLKSAETQLQNFNDQQLRSTSNLEKLEGGTKAFAGGIALASGAIALFGVENEKVAQSLVKLQAALALANGVKDLGEGFAKLNITGSKITSTFKNIGNVIKGNPILLLAGVIVSLLAASGQLDDIIQLLGKTFGQVFEKIQPVLDVLGNLIQQAIDPLLKVLVPLVEVLGKSLVPIIQLALVPLQIFGEVLGAAAPIIEIVGQAITTLIEPIQFLAEGLGGAISAFSEWLGLNEEGAEKQEVTIKSTEELEKAYQTLQTANENVNSAKQFEIDLLKAQGASIDEIRKKELELAKTKREQAVANAKQVKADAELALQALGTNEADQKERERLNNLIIASEKAVTEADRAEKLLQANITRETAKEQADARKKSADDAKKARDERLKDISDAQKKALDTIKKGIVEEQDAAKDASEERLKQLRDDLTKRQEFGVEAEETLAQAQRDEAEKLLQTQIELSQKELTQIKDNKKLSDQAKLDLENETNEKIEDLRNQLSIKQRENAKIRNQEEIQDLRDNAEEQARILETTIKEGQLQATQETTKQLQDLNERFRNGDIKDLEEYEKEKEKITNEANTKSLNDNEIAAQKQLDLAIKERDDLLANQKEGSEEYLAIQAEFEGKIIDAQTNLANAQKAISEDTSNQIISDAQKAAEEQQIAIEQTIDAVTRISASIASLAQPLSENFNNVGLQVTNAFASISSQLPSLAESLTKPLKEGATETEKLAAQAEKVAAAFQFAAGAIGEVGNILANESAKRLEALQVETEETLTTIEEQQTAEIEAIDAQVEAGILSKERGDAAKAQIEKRYNDQLIALQTQQQEKEKALKRKAFNQEKAVRIATAVAQGTAATLNAFAAGSVFGPIVGGVFAGLAAAFAATQIALISSQKFPEDAGGSTTPAATTATPSVGGGGGLAPQQSTSFQDLFATGASQETTQGFGNNSGGGAVRAYVVESDISSTQNRLDRIRTSSEL